MKNKKAYHNYCLLETFEAGVVLVSSEIKSIRQGKISFKDSYCYIKNDEIFLKNFHISEQKNHQFEKFEPDRDRKLLLNKKEIRKIKKKVEEKGFTIVPTKIYINSRGIAKFEIAIAQGKREYEKRATIKLKDLRLESGENFRK